MKKCPYCAEEIQDTAIKCRYCGEWLKANEHKSDAVDVEKNGENKKPKKAVVALKEIKVTTVIIYAAAISIAILIVDAIIGLFLKNLLNECALIMSNILSSSIYIAVGIGIAELVYLVRRYFLVLFISIIGIIILRYLILWTILIKMNIINETMLGTAIISTGLEIVIVYSAAVIFILLFRFAEAKFPFAEISNIEVDIRRDGKEHDFGICSRCGAKTIIATERFINVLGKRERHFCDNCGIFLRSNPFHAIFAGLAEGTLSFIFFMGAAAKTEGQTSMPQKAFFLLLFIGMVDGIRRLFAGIKGVIIQPKKEFDKTES